MNAAHSLATLLRLVEELTDEHFANHSERELKRMLSRGIVGVATATYTIRTGLSLNLGLVDRRVKPRRRKLAAVAMPLATLNVVFVSVELNARRRSDATFRSMMSSPTSRAPYIP